MYTHVLSPTLKWWADRQRKQSGSGWSLHYSCSCIGPKLIRMAARPQSIIIGYVSHNRSKYVPYLKWWSISSCLFLWILTQRITYMLLTMQQVCRLTSPHPTYCMSHHLFFYVPHATERLKHFSVDLWLSSLRLLSASPSSLGTKGSQNATMSLYSACAQLRVHEKRVTFNHLCSRAGIQLRMDGCRLTGGWV